MIPSSRPRRPAASSLPRPFVLVLAFLVLVPALAAADPTEETARFEQPQLDSGRGSEDRAALAAAFLEEATEQFLAASILAERAAWLQATYITHDSEIVAAALDAERTALAVELANRAAAFDDVELSPDLRRQMNLLKLALTLPAPQDAAKTAELSRIASEMQSMYGRGEYCFADGDCQGIVGLGRIMAESRDPAKLLETWVGWRTISPPMRDEFERYVELGNEGARELGYADLGAMWRSKYDMPADAFAAELDRLWSQVRPLYDQLHCHVRAELAEAYGADVVDAAGPIPAHVLGNMWAQSWGNVYEMVAPPGGAASYDLTELLRQAGVDEVEMVKIGERFFSSLGFAPLPETFWERSMFTQPADRDVVCHASAWDLDWVEDLRIKMCIEVTSEDFDTIHHELGHNYYQRAYNRQPVLYRDSANDGFHEAVGDAVALSITPEYLKEIGLLDEVPPASEDLGLLMRTALEKIAFLPFGLLIDQWRWQVFSGEITPAEYNASWWELREKYQGVAAPVERTEANFDPGAKYHVPASVPYTRYFLAHILQFQFHRALCDAAGFEGPLHRCSIYGSEEAGKRLQDMLAMGQSRPWPDALEAITGQRQMDATAILDYFAPLEEWLEEENAGRQCGW